MYVYLGAVCVVVTPNFRSDGACREDGTLITSVCTSGWAPNRRVLPLRHFGPVVALHLLRVRSYISTNSIQRLLDGEARHGAIMTPQLDIKLVAGWYFGSFGIGYEVGEVSKQLHVYSEITSKQATVGWPTFCGASWTMSDSTPWFPLRSLMYHFKVASKTPI